jgi:uncharacterized lipoprotein YmbA
MKMRLFRICMIIICWLAAALTGCSHSPRVTFYTLEAATTAETAPPGTTSLSVEVGPVTLPVVVDRPQLVIRVAANRVDILEMHRWAEPLKSSISRLIADNLARQLGPVRVSVYPQNASENADYRVLVDVQRFDGTPGESVKIDALWSVRHSGGVTTRTGRSVVNEKVAGESYDALVAAYGRALAAVSRDITSAIRTEESMPH